MITTVPMSCELLQMLCEPNLLSRNPILRCLFSFFYYQCQESNPLVMQKNNEDFWKCAMGSLIFFCLPAMRSLPGGWVVRLESQLAKYLLSTPMQKTHEINTFSPHQTINFILSLALSHALCLLSLSGFVSIFTLTFSIMVTKCGMGILAFIHEVPHVNLSPLKHNQFPFSSCIAHVLYFLS